MDNFKLPIILSAIIIGAAGLFGYNMIYMPKQAQVAEIRAKIAQERQTQEAQAELAILLRQFEDNRKRLPPEADSAWFTRKILDVVQESGIQLANISQQPSQVYQGFTHYSVNLSFAASYHALGKFLDEIERADSFFRIERIAVASPMSVGSNPQIELVLGTIYVPPAIGPGSIPLAAAVPVH